MSKCQTKVDAPSFEQACFNFENGSRVKYTQCAILNKDVKNPMFAVRLYTCPIVD